MATASWPSGWPSSCSAIPLPPSPSIWGGWVLGVRAGRRGGWRHVRAVPARRVPGTSSRSVVLARLPPGCLCSSPRAGRTRCSRRPCSGRWCSSCCSWRRSRRSSTHGVEGHPLLAVSVTVARGSVHGRHTRVRALPAAPAGGRPGGLARVGPRAGGVGRPRAGCLSRSAHLGERLVRVLRWAALWGAASSIASGEPRQDGAGRAGRARRNRVARGGVRRAGFPTVAGPADRPARRNRWCAW